MNAKRCDRCKKFYDDDEALERFTLSDPRWRYDITYDAHPYGVIVKDLCPDCRESLYSWFIMENNNG